MEPAQRANAAQLAARSIKAAKPQRNRLGGLKPSNSSTQQQFPQISTPLQNGGGGLFGGSIQAPGEFSFSAPAQGLNLPPSTFGARPNTMNTSSEDITQHEGRFEGDDRTTKRQFGAPSTMSQSSSVFQTNSFGQSQPNNPFGSTQQSSEGNLFQFGGSKQSGPSGINFNSGPSTPAKPADNPFSFQPAPSAPSTSFGSGQFNFNQQLAQTQNRPGKYDFTVGATAPYSLPAALQQDKPASSPFSFGQTSGQPSNTGMNFGSTPATAPPTSNLFGSTLQTPTSNLFGATTTTAPPTRSLYGSASTTAAPQDKPADSPFLFGKTSVPPSSSGTTFGTTPATAPATSNFFGSTQPQQPTQSTGLFRSTSQQAPPSTNPFAHLNVPASPANNGFEKQEQKVAAPATSNISGTQNPVQAPTTNSFFGNPTQTPTTSSTSTLFGQQKPQPSPSTNVFGNLNKPTTSNAESNNQNQPAPSGILFGNKEAKSTNDLLGNLNKPVDQPVTQSMVDSSTSESGTNPRPSLFSRPSPAANIFGAPKSLFPASPAKQAEPATNGIKPAPSFDTIQSATAQANGSSFSPMKPIDAPATASQPPPNGMFPSLEPAKTSQKLNKSSSIPANPAASSSDGLSQTEALRHEMASAREQLKEATAMTDESMAHLVPPHFSDFQRRKFYTGYRIRTLNSAISKFFAVLGHDEDPTPDIRFYEVQRRSILADSLKRKIGEVPSEGIDHPSKRSKQSAQSELTESHGQLSKRKVDDEEDQENENPSKRTRQIERSSSVQDLTDGQVNPDGHTSTPANGNNFQAWKAQTSGLPSSETPLKRKANDQMTKDSVERSPLRPMKTPKTNSTIESSSLGSSTSNIFRNILDSPSKSPGKSVPEKKMAALPGTSKDGTARVNPFVGLPGVKSMIGGPSLSTFGTKVTSATSMVSPQNLFTPKPTSGDSSMFTPKLEASPNAVAGSISTELKAAGLKPPTFGTLSNPLEQFKQKAKEDEEKTEEKAWQKALDEDYDSDEDLEEFKSNWKAKRVAEKKAIEEAAKSSKRGGFVPTPTSATASSPFKAGSNQTNITSEPPGSTAQPAAESNSMFSQIANTSSQASGNSVFSSSNGSRTPTPGPNGSSTGSVFDGYTPGKPTNLGNIFGHLSDAESGKGGDADDESGDEASDGEGDSEKKDPSYQPGGENASGPGTPVEKTGAGIASAKKMNAFAFGDSKISSGSPSGTSSPGGNLFDRITRGDDGKPVRHIWTEEKENTQPSTTNIFGNINNTFNKSNGTPSDNTWKQDSPIRFGNAIPHKDEQDSGPTVSVTAATPTKTGSPSNIFGDLNNTSGSTQKPLSSLFGNSGGESKQPTSFSNIFGTPSNATASTSANVGFGFGASSTTSSLFPSAAASATTSRATTPGGTTDGDNSGDGDAEAEKQDQINLAAGGPGEEDEEVIHEIRAKALKFSPKEGSDNSNQWETQGVGPLRVLKHKDTGVSRILLRADPRGQIVLNKGLLSGVKYEAQAKTVKFLTAGDHGKGLETWILQVKTEEFAKALAEVLEASKAA